MMSTQTQPAAPDADADEPTVVVDDDKATALAALAWSHAAEDYPDTAETLLYDYVEPFVEADRTTLWLRLSVATAGAVVAILGVTLWHLLAHAGPELTPAAPTVPTSSTAAAPVPSGPDDKIVPSTTEPAPAPPPVIAEPPPVKTEAPPPPPPVAAAPEPGPRALSPDDQYLATLAQYGISSGSGDGRTLIMGHAVCRHLGIGEARDQIIGEVKQQNPALPTLSSAEIIVDSAIGIYCPQYTGR